MKMDKQEIEAIVLELINIDWRDMHGSIDRPLRTDEDKESLANDIAEKVLALAEPSGDHGGFDNADKPTQWRVLGGRGNGIFAHGREEMSQSDYMCEEEKHKITIRNSPEGEVLPKYCPQCYKAEFGGTDG